MRRFIPFCIVCALGCGRTFITPTSLPIDAARHRVDASRTWPTNPPDEDFRRTRPGPDAQPVRPPPRIAWSNLSNGIRVLVVEQHALPIVSLGVVIGRGWVDAPPGQLDVLVDALTAGSVEVPADRAARILANRGASMHSSSDQEVSGVFVRSLKPYADLPAQLLGRAMTQPSLDMDALSRMKRAALNDAALDNADSPLAAATAIAQAEIYPNHPYGVMPKDEPEGVNKLTNASLLALYTRMVGRDDLTVIATGDVDLSTVVGWFEPTLGQLQRTAAPRADIPAVAMPQRKLIALDRRALTQDTVVVEFLGVSYSDPDFPALSVLGDILAVAGHQRVRLEEGTSYGVSATMPGLRGASPLQLGWRVEPSGTTKSIRDMLEAIAHVRSGNVDTVLLDAVKRAHAQSGLEAGDSNGEVLSTLIEAVNSGRKPTDFPALFTRVMDVTPDDVRRVAEKFLDVDHMVIVVAGEGARVKASLESLDLGPVEQR
jgi:zinc protease